MKRVRPHLACALAVLALAAACGQKGPLYLPDKKPGAVEKPAPAAPQTTPQTEKIDPDKKDDSSSQP